MQRAAATRKTTTKKHRPPSTPATTTAVPDSALVQRASEMPEMLRVEEIMQLQKTLGNRGTSQLLRPPAPPPTSTAQMTRIQRQYTGALIIYDTMDNEKTQGSIHTGKAKFGKSVTSLVKAFTSSLATGNINKIRAALAALHDRLDSDSKAKLKKPKKNSGVTVLNQYQLAQAFFTKWKGIVTDHISYLNDNGGLAVTDFQQAYGVTPKQDKKKKGKESDSESESDDDVVITNVGNNNIQIVNNAPPFNFNNPAWDFAYEPDVRGSGMGGAVIFTFPGGHKLAVKSGANAGQNEVLAARMARQSGLTAPDTRFATNIEQGEIQNLFQRLNVNVPWGEPYLVVEFLEGTSTQEAFGGKGKPNKQQVNSLAAAYGRWFAFCLITGDTDNFYDLTGNNARGVNTGNYLYDRNNPNNISGFDQHVMNSNLNKTNDALTVIKNGDGLFALNIARSIYEALGSPQGIDQEDLIPIIMAAAKQQLLSSAQSLTLNTITQAAQGLPNFDQNKVQTIATRVQQFAQHVQ